MEFLARVYITLKPTVNDPQGLTVEGALRDLGFNSVRGVRVGRYLEVRLEAPTRGEAEALVQDMCQRLLANTVVEQFRFDLEEVPAQAGEGVSR